MRTRLTVAAVLVAVFVLGISIQAQIPTPVLIGNLSSPDPKARAQAANMLGNIGGREVVDCLIKALDDKEWSVRLAVVIALSKCQDSRVVEPLVGILQKDSEAYVRMGAAQALGKIGDPSAIGPLKQARNDPDDLVGKAAVVSLTLIQQAPRTAPAPEAQKPPAAPASKTPVGAPETGEVLVFFETSERGDPVSDLAVQRIGRDGMVLWGPTSGGVRRPVLVENGYGSSSSPVAVDDGEGGAIVAFEFKELSGPDKDLPTAIVGQRISREGKVLWRDDTHRRAAMVSSPVRPLKRPVIVSDGQGGAVVVAEKVSRPGDTDILANRINSAGRLLWNKGVAPILVSAFDNDERNPAVVADGQGGAFVFFEVVITGHAIAIAGQHISADGRLLWEDRLHPHPIALTDNREQHPVAVSDGAGGAIVVFETELTSGKYKGDIDISAQRVTSDGKLLWGPLNKPASVASPVGMDRNPVAIADGAGGAIIAWEHEPTEGADAGDTDIFAQRMDAEGRKMWLEGKKAVALLASKLLERAPAIVPDGRGGAIVICEAESRTGKDAGDIDLLAQRISADGTKLWNEGKSSQRIASSQWRERWPVAAPDGEGGAFVVYTALGVREDEGEIDIEIKRLDGSGKLLWNEGKVPMDVAATKDLERNPRVVVVSKR